MDSISYIKYFWFIQNISIKKVIFDSYKMFILIKVLILFEHIEVFF
jgi:hypothetical protein